MRKKMISTALLASIALGHSVPLRATDKSQDLPALKAKKVDLENELTSLRAQDQSDASVAEQLLAKETELESLETKIETAELKARNITLEQAVVSQRTKDAKEAVKAAVKRGAIPTKDDALQAKWETRCIQDPENIELLASIKGSAALDRTTAPQRLILSGGAQVLREDSQVVLRAYRMEKNAAKKAEIWARDLRERIKEGDPLPLRADNSLGTLAGELISQQTLELLSVQLPEMNMFSTDFSEAGVKINQEVNSRIVGIPESSDYDPATGYSDEDSIMVDVPVVIDEHKSVAIVFNVEELASTSRRLFDEMAPAAAYRVSSDLVTKALAQITAANFTEAATVEALIDFDRTSVINIGGALSDRGVPTTPRFLLLNGAYYDALKSDPTIVSLGANQQAQIITGSKLIQVDDFNITRTATLPNTGNLVGFGGSKSALVIAGRAPNDYTAATNGAHGVVQLITNPVSRFTVAYVEYVDHKLGKTVKRLAYMYGAAKGQIKAGQRLVSANP
jgi:hypothetical protein